MMEISCRWGTDTGMALVSDVDYPLLSEHTWHISESNASGKPYVRTTIGRATVYMHRMIVQCPPTMKVDHRNCDGLHNYRSNLRVATHEHNNLNRQFWSKSGYKGVSKDGGRFRARIMLDGVEKGLGRFDSAVEAAVAYDIAAYELFGEFAWFNFPESWPSTVDAEPAEVPF